ncbi:MAG: carboxypeptidase regulatory-like domain-containing protein, partial [Sphingobacteriales bacterium]
MKKKFYSFFILLVLASFNFQCKQESSTINTPQPPGNPVNPDPVTANLQGNVVDENGNPASGVTVQVGAKTTTSNANGFFRIEQAGLDKQSSVVTVQKNGYFKAYRSFCATNGTNQVEIKLVKKTNAGTIASASGGTVTLPDGTKITLPAAGVVKQGSTTAYSGNILVYATYLDPSSADISQTIPGSMMGDDKNGNRTTLQSFGLISVELESAAGEKLQMATGKKAQLTVAIPSSLQTSAPSTISMWYVDEQTGIWKEEGTATKTGTNYVGEVSHFTFWGLNVSGPAVLLTATLKNAQNVLLPYTTVRIKRMVNGVANYGMAITDSLGQVSGLVPKDVVMDFQVMDYCSNIAYSQSIGPFTANTSLSVINANIPANYSLMVKGTAVNCNGQPIANAQVTVTRNYQQWYLRTNSTGEFQLNTLHCGTGNVTVQAHD